MSACIYVYIYIYFGVCMQVCMHVCICIYNIYIYTFIYIYRHPKNSLETTKTSLGNCGPTVAAAPCLSGGPGT